MMTHNIMLPLSNIIKFSTTRTLLYIGKSGGNIPKSWNQCSPWGQSHIIRQQGQWHNSRDFPKVFWNIYINNIIPIQVYLSKAEHPFWFINSKSAHRILQKKFSLSGSSLKRWKINLCDFFPDPLRNLKDTFRCKI